MRTTLPIPHNDLSFVNNIANTNTSNIGGGSATKNNNISQLVMTSKAKNVTPVLPL